MDTGRLTSLRTAPAASSSFVLAAALVALVSSSTSAWGLTAAAASTRGTWTQAGGDAGLTNAASSAPAPAFRQAWAAPVPPAEASDRFGASAPVWADEVIVGGPIVAVAPQAVVGLNASDGTRLFSVDRVFGPSVPPAVALVGGRQVVVYTQGWGSTSPTASTSATASASPAGGSPAPTPGLGVSQLAAFDLRTHRRLWPPVRLGERVSRTGVTVVGSTAYVGDAGGDVYAVDLASGKLVWKRPVGGDVGTQVAATGGFVVVTIQGTRSASPAVVGLRASDGSEAWRFNDESPLSQVTPASLSGDLAYAAFSDGNIRALSLTDGSVRWTARTHAAVLPSNQLAVSGNAVYAIDQAGQLYRFDASTGDRVWDFALNEPIYRAPPVATEGAVLLGTVTGRLIAIDAGSGRLVWESGTGSAILRSLAPRGSLVVGVRGGAGGGLVAFAHDGSQALVDVVSPTVFNAGSNAAAYALVAVPLLALLVLGGRLLRRRMGPAFIYEDDEPTDPIEDTP